MNEPIQPAIRLKQVRHFESRDSEYDAANEQLKKGWLYLGMTKDIKSGEVYLILGEPEDAGTPHPVEQDVILAV